MRRADRAVDPAAAHARAARLGGAAGAAGVHPGRAGHRQRQAVAAAGRGRGAQRRRGAAAVRAGLAAGAAAGGGLMDKRIAGQYWELTKPRVVSLIVFTAVVGMFLAVPGLPPLRESVFGLLGLWLAAASAAAIHHLIDQRVDKVMARTANRPLATGTLQPSQRSGERRCGKEWVGTGRSRGSPALLKKKRET